jgi:hypothetical protein
MNPVAVRREQAFVRMKRKAEREGKQVSVSDGTICIMMIRTLCFQREMDL